jgi:hypothetical protein
VMRPDCNDLGGQRYRFSQHLLATHERVIASDITGR